MKLSLILLILSSFLSLFSTQNNQIRSDFYNKISEFNNFEFDSSFLLNSFESTSHLKCLSICLKVAECFYIAYQQKRCFICNRNLTLFLNYKPDGVSSIYQKKTKFYQTNGLINYWAFNGNVRDSIGNADLYEEQLKNDQEGGFVIKK